MRENKIVYVSFGGQKFEDQTRYSVLTLLDLLLEKGRDDYRIVVYTDRPERVPEHAWISAVLINADELRRWRGPLENVHRIRLEILHKAVEDFGLPLVYVDSDTRWLALPDEPFERLRTPDPATGRLGFFMHTQEGVLSPRFHPHYLNWLSTHSSQLESFGLPTAAPWRMWNAGVMGVPVGAENFFSGIMQAHDALLPHITPRNFVDQLIISLRADGLGELQGFEPYLHHYWNFSQEAPILLRGFLSGIDTTLPVEQQARQCGEHVWDDASLRRIFAAKGSAYRRRINKMRSSLRKRRIDFKAFLLRMRTRGWMPS